MAGGDKSQKTEKPTERRKKKAREDGQVVKSPEIVPWLLVLGIPYGLYRIISDPPSPGWLWFFGGIVFSISFIFLLSTLALRKQRALIAREDQRENDNENNT